MEQSPSWADRFAASHEIPRILWNTKVHYRIHKCPPPASILSQLNPVYTPTSYFLKISLNIILPSRPGSPQWCLSLRFPTKSCTRLSPPYPSYMPRSSHSSRFYHPHNSGWGLEIMKLVIIKISPHLVPLRPKYSPQHPILKNPQPTLVAPSIFGEVKKHDQLKGFWFITKTRLFIYNFPSANVLCSCYTVPVTQTSRAASVSARLSACVAFCSAWEESIIRCIK
jgi:hypothetical protein